MLPPPMNARVVHACELQSCARVVRRKSPCRFAPRSRRPRSPLRDRRTCPSTACRAAKPCALQLRRSSPPAASNSARCSSKRFARRRDAHETAQPQARQLARLRRASGASSVGGDAALAGLVRQPHLDTYIERRRVVRALLVEAHGDALAIERVHPVKVLGDGARLVGLQLSGEVPGQRQVGERCELRQRFLQVVFAEIPLAAARPARGSPRRAVPC